MASMLVPVLTLWWWIEYYAGSDKWYEVDTYKGVTITHERWKCWDKEGVLGCYFFAWPNKGTINMERYLTEWQYKNILEHEFWHHIYWHYMTDHDREVWGKITNHELMIPLLEKHGYSYKPTYVSWYASTHIREDFAESFSHEDAQKKTYARIKQVLAQYYGKKYYWVE